MVSDGAEAGPGAWDVKGWTISTGTETTSSTRYYLLENRQTGNFSIFNLGTGEGVSVLEAIHSFEKVSGQKLNYTIGAKRPGDVGAIYSDNSYSEKTLGWSPVYSLDQMMETAWKWELQKAKEEEKM